MASATAGQDLFICIAESHARLDPARSIA